MAWNVGGFFSNLWDNLSGNSANRAREEERKRAEAMMAEERKRAEEARRRQEEERRRLEDQRRREEEARRLQAELEAKKADAVRKSANGVDFKMLAILGGLGLAMMMINKRRY